MEYRTSSCYLYRPVTCLVKPLTKPNRPGSPRRHDEGLIIFHLSASKELDRAANGQTPLIVQHNGEVANLVKDANVLIRSVDVRHYTHRELRAGRSQDSKDEPC